MDKRIIAAASFGTLFEMYDYAIYGFMAPILAPLFFPAADKHIALIATFGVFAAGFLVRPFSAYWLGNLGDQIGRRKTLTITLMIMTFSSSFIGLLPTYQEVGIFAPVLLTLCRLAQGISVAGEMTLASIYIYENVSMRHKGLAVSFVTLGSIGGLLLAIIVSKIALIFFSRQYLDFYWRFPFLIGIFVGFVGLYLRSQTRELTDFAKRVAKKQVHPILNAWRYRKKAIAAIFLLAIYCNSSFYTFFVYMPSYLQQQELSLTAATDVIIIGMICYSMGLLLSGFTSDVLGRRFPLAVSLIATLCSILAINYLINTGTLLQVTVACSALAIIISFYIGSAFTASLEQLPQEERASGFTLFFNLGNSLFGGTAPLIILLLSYVFKHFAFSIYLMVMALLTFPALWLIQGKSTN
ncbi:MFS transporter [Legionella sp. PATHC032]|uniref:MFS transporter n=1 Tax=Legionella sp. PATHC032 TaxID=2992039 RepID=UPI001B192D1D|nr:MFS transporter [Legionella sp. PATHC032]MCW8422346.1 MFS transporter [Legionella sp. PATHC032]HAZ7574227.1 MHS family MFS transporter [Legionella pneumophila]HBA1635807.1 MHS family MFS transporter [Legionella pneumophila]